MNAPLRTVVLSEGPMMPHGTLAAAMAAVAHFHATFALNPAPSVPTMQDQFLATRRANWIKEEMDELLEADDVASQADAYIDAIYFALGGLAELGIDPSPLFDIVHHANMAKLQPDGSVKRHPETRKVLKPEGWTAPEPLLRAEVVRQMAVAASRGKAHSVAPELIGLVGLKGSGKDTAASALSGYENVKMAGPLKGMLRSLLRYQGVDEIAIDRMIDGDLKEEPSAYLGGRSPRFAMQTLGTEWGRQIMADDLWIRLAEARAALFDRVVITDVRFPNEAAMIKRLGGVLVRVERAGLTTEAHASEDQVAHLPVDAVLVNDANSAKVFADDAAVFFEGLV